jgi:hypothetical protein
MIINDPLKAFIVQFKYNRVLCLLNYMNKKKTFRLLYNMRNVILISIESNL